MKKETPRVNQRTTSDSEAATPLDHDGANSATQQSTSDVVLVSGYDEDGKCATADVGALPLCEIASHLPHHDFLSFRRVNRRVQDCLNNDWLKDTFYRLCQAALTDGDDGQGYTGGNKAKVKRLLDLAAAREDKTLLRQLLTMKVTNKTREIKEYGAHRPQGTLYGMLLKRGYTRLNEKDKGLAEIVADYYAYFDDGETLRQAEHEAVFPKLDETDTRSLEERVKDTFAQQKPFNFMPIINAINAASDADLKHQRDNPRDTSTDLGRAIQAFRDAFDEVSRHEEIYNLKHYPQALSDAGSMVHPWGLQDQVFSSQVFGYVQKNMPTHLLHAHAQGTYIISMENSLPVDSPIFNCKKDGHVVFGRWPCGAATLGIGDKFFAGRGGRLLSGDVAGLRTRGLGVGVARSCAQLFSNNTTRLIRLMQRSPQRPQHPHQNQCVMM